MPPTPAMSQVGTGTFAQLSMKLDASLSEPSARRRCPRVSKGHPATCHCLRLRPPAYQIGTQDKRPLRLKLGRHQTCPPGVHSRHLQDSSVHFWLKCTLAEFNYASAPSTPPLTWAHIQLPRQCLNHLACLSSSRKTVPFRAQSATSETRDTISTVLDNFLQASNHCQLGDLSRCQR